MKLVIIISFLALSACATQAHRFNQAGYSSQRDVAQEENSGTLTLENITKSTALTKADLIVDFSGCAIPKKDFLCSVSVKDALHVFWPSLKRATSDGIYLAFFAVQDMPHETGHIVIATHHQKEASAAIVKKYLQEFANLNSGLVEVDDLKVLVKNVSYIKR